MAITTTENNSAMLTLDFGNTDIAKYLLAIVREIIERQKPSFSTYELDIINLQSSEEI